VRRSALALAFTLALAACGDSSEPPTQPTLPALPASVRGDIRITLAHDSESGSTIYQVDTSAPGDGASLEPALRAAQQAWAQTHRDAPTVTIDAVQTVPWSDVMVAFSACQRLKLRNVDFVYDRTRPK